MLDSEEPLIWGVLGPLTGGYIPSCKPEMLEMRAAEPNVALADVSTRRAAFLEFSEKYMLSSLRSCFSRQVFGLARRSTAACRS
jgi:hypothetical protein